MEMIEDVSREIDSISATNAIIKERNRWESELRWKDRKKRILSEH